MSDPAVEDDEFEDASTPAKSKKAPNAFRTISEVADELHIPQHVLRLWETRFPQVKPLKRGGGRRYYRPDDILLLRRISDLLYIQGYTIKGVQRLLRESGGKLSDNIPPPPPEERESIAPVDPQLPLSLVAPAPVKAANFRAGWQTKGWWRLVGGVDRVGEGDGRGGRGRVRLAPAGRLGAGRDPRSGPNPPVHLLSLSFRCFFTLSFGRRGPRPTPARSPAPTMSGPSPARLLPSAAPAYAPGRLALKKER